MTITTHTIMSAQVGAVLRDHDVPGLHVRIQPARRSYYLYYRTREGRERRPKLGDHPTLSLPEARKISRALLLRVANGEDPGARIAQARKEAKDTVGEHWGSFMDHVSATAKPRTVTEYEGAYRRYVHKYLGGMSVREVTNDVAAAVHRDLKTVPVAANRVVALMSAYFRHLVRAGLATSNPFEGIRKYTERKHERILSEDEARAVRESMDRHEAKYTEGVAYLKLLWLTGARPDELSRLRWEDVKDGVAILRDHKTQRTGAFRKIYLSESARRVLNKVPKGSGLVFGENPPRRLWSRISKEAGCPDMRMYDLRHTYASAALEAGVPLDQVGMLLGHTSVQTTKRYAHLAPHVGSAAAERAAEVIGM